MKKEELIKKMAESIGAIDKEVKTAFDIFLRRMSEVLELNQSIRIPEIGIFQLKKRSAIRQDRKEPQNQKGLSESYYLLFVPLHYNKTAPNEILAFRVPEKKKNDPVLAEDTAFSLSYGKPVIPLNESQRREFLVQSSYLLLQKSLEQKVERLLSGAIHLNDFNIDYRQVILEDEERQDSFDLRKELEEPGDSFGETVEWDFGKEEDGIPDTGFITQESPSEDNTFTGEDSEGREDLKEAFSSGVEDSFTFDMDNPELRSVITEDDAPEQEASQEAAPQAQAFPEVIPPSEKEIPGQDDFLSELISEDNPFESFVPEKGNEQPAEDSAADESDSSASEDLLSQIVWEEEEDFFGKTAQSGSMEESEDETRRTSDIISGSRADEFKMEDFSFEEFNKENSLSDNTAEADAFDDDIFRREEPSIAGLSEDENLKDEPPAGFETERYEETERYDEDTSDEEEKPKESLGSLEEEFGQDKKEGLSPLFWGILIVLLLVTSVGIYYFFFSGTGEKNKTTAAAGASKSNAQVIERDYDIPVSYIPNENNSDNEAAATENNAGAENAGAENAGAENAAEKKAAENQAAGNKTQEGNNPAANASAGNNQAARNENKSPQGEIFRNDNKDQMVQSQIFSDGSRFTVQLSSWRQRSVAEKEARRLRSAGHDAYVTAYSPNPGTTWYRVRVGSYSSVNEAAGILRKLK